MSFQATKFVLELRGLTPAQKAVAFALACHANQHGGNSYPSMERIAHEAGFEDRRSAQRRVRQLEKMKIVVAMTPKTGGHGHDTATVYKLNFDYEPTMRCDSPAAPPDANLDDGGVTNQTMRGDSLSPEGRQPGHSKRYEEGKKREGAESRVQEPHTPNLDLHRKVENAEEVKPKQAPTPDHQNQNQSTPPSKTTSNPNHPVQASKDSVAAPEVARLQAEILRIPLSGGRHFQSSSKVEAIIRAELANGRPARLILAAAEYIGATLSERDRMPGLTLADNLAARIVALELDQAEAAEERQRRERAAADNKLTKRRYELIKAALIEQEEEVGREYNSWQRERPEASADSFYPSEHHPLLFERYRLAESLKTRQDIFAEKRLIDLRTEAGESQAILASVEAQLAAEGLRC